MQIKYPGDDYELFSYPAGEVQARIKPERIPLIHAVEEIQIDAYAASPTHLIGLILLSDAIRGIRPDARLILNIPYLPYARADRRFVDGDCFGLKVFGDIVRMGGFDQIRTLDVHNVAKAHAYVSSFLHNASPIRLIDQAIESFTGKIPASKFAVLLPDAGSVKRYRFDRWPSLPVLVAGKTRDPATGTLTGFTVPPDVHNYDGVLIVDDICDAGGTFLGIAAEIQKHDPVPILGLYVTHGIFSRGVERLANVFAHIYTTDSFQPKGLYRDSLADLSPKAELPDFLTVYDAFEESSRPT